MRVTIWHNISTDEHTRHLGMMDGYEEGHALVPVAAYDVETPEGLVGDGDDLIGADRLRVNNELRGTLASAYRIFNVGDDPAFGTPDPLAVEYRARRNRSLSVGDVIQLSVRPASEHPIGKGDRWFTCASADWVPIEDPTWFAIGASCYGTTSLDDKPWNRF